MRRNLKSKAILAGILSLILLATALISSGVSMRGTQALLTDTEISRGNSFTAGIWETNILSLSPGTSKATYVTMPGPFPPIASFDENGQLKLDFGEIQAGNSNNSPDVFRINNLTGESLTVELKLSTNLVSLFFWVRLEEGNSLAPGQEKRVEMKLNTSPNTSPGIYTGSLTVSPGDGYLQKVIPTQIAVLSR